MNYEVEKGIEIPGGGKKKYPWDEMEVGDSFFIPGLGEVPRNIASSAPTHRKKRGEKYTTRKVEGGYRIWRTK